MKIRFAVGPHGGSLSGRRIVEFAEAVELAGFDGLWLSDLPVAPVLDPLLGLALAAGRTRRLHLGANLVPLGRNPFLLAKELAQLDQLSGGRLLLSFVTGLGQPGERQALGLDGARRGDVLEEVLGLVRAWWARSWITGPSVGRSIGLRRRHVRFRIRSRCGWAGADPRRWTAWGGSPMGGWALS
jgi:alkanesulfonate monooxygenase SsuD/methylene tetrahydromethanopterin reductase-like flavin-dependent oxidoreductase (luciferase family)